MVEVGQTPGTSESYEEPTKRPLHPGPPGWFGYAPDILYTAESEDERFSFMIQAGLEPDDDRPGYMRRTNPVVYSLLIMDDVGEAGSSSDHATIEDAKAHAAAATGIRDLDWRPFVQPSEEP